MSLGVNAAVIRAHREGILTETSLMVSGRSAAEAVSLALQTPSLGVGLHLVLVQGQAASAPWSIPDLVDRDGAFAMHPIHCGLRYFFVRRLRQQIEREIVAQLELFRASGLPLSHVDGHLTIHLHPVVLDILCTVGPRYGLRAIRLPLEPLRPSLAFDRRFLGRKLQEAAIFSILSRWARRRVERHGLRYADQMFGMHQTGHVSEAYLLHLIPRLPEGVTELYGHPGVSDDEIRRWTPTYDRDGELAALVSPRVRAALAQSKVELTRWGDV